MGAYHRMSATAIKSLPLEKHCEGGAYGSTNVGTVVTGFSDTQLRDSAKRGDWEVWGQWVLNLLMNKQKDVGHLLLERGPGQTPENSKLCQQYFDTALQIKVMGLVDENDPLLK